MAFDISSDFEHVVDRLGNLICQTLNWQPGERWDFNAGESYCFFSVDATKKDAEQSFQQELITRLDQLTERRSLLFELCKEVAVDG